MTSLIDHRPEGSVGFRRFLLVSAIAVAGILSSGAAWAVHLIGNIELDGNTVNDGGAVPGIDDWDDVFAGTDSALRSVFVTDSAVNDQTVFSGGIKDTQSLNQWTCRQSTVQNKSDLLHAYGATYSAGGEVLLYAGADRKGNAGTSNMGVWLFQQPVSCVSTGGTTPFVGTHLDGDLLLVAEFDQGGRVEEIKVYRWSDPDGTPQSGDECLGGAAGDCSDAGVPAFTGLNCNDSNPGDMVCGRTNPVAPINAAWRANIPSQGFYEAGANLTDLIGDVGCFATAMIETRSSTSLTATLKDFVLLELSTCGTLTVEKVTSGGSGEFGFSVTPDPGPPGSPFSLLGGESAFFGTVEPGTYNIAEDVLPPGPPEPNGWNLTDITCVGGSPGVPDIPGIGHDGGNIDVDIDLSDDVVCTFTNVFTSPPSAITIGKVCESVDAGGQTFDFSLTGFGGSTTPDCADGSISLGCGQSLTCEGLSAGDYTVDEAIPAGWELSDVACVGGVSTCGPGEAPDATITLGAGESATATFTNTENATIEICKSTVPAGVGGDFSFGGDLGAFLLADGECSAVFEVAPGVPYDVTEADKAGFILTEITCAPSVNWTADESLGLVTITPDPGEAVQCTFTNSENPGFVRICKETVTTSGDNPSFTVRLNGPDDDLEASTGLQNGECDLGMGDSNEVQLTAGGPYMVSEDPAEGWITDVSCEGSEGPEPADAIDVSAGEQVVCTFTNTQLGSITIGKDCVSVDAGAQTFDFAMTGFAGSSTIGCQDNAVTLACGESVVCEGLAGGDYTVDESIPGGWVLSDVTCVAGVSTCAPDAAPDASITLDVGEAASATFTNTENATIEICKSTNPAGGGGFGFSGDLGDFLLGDGECEGPIEVAPGVDYSVTEADSPGFTLSDISCAPSANWTADLALNLVTVTPAAGEAVQCTFTNTADPARFRVTKTFSDGTTYQVDVTLTCNSGLPLEQTFTIAGGDPEGVTFVVTDIPPAGATCEVTESGVPDGYTTVLNGGEGCTWEGVVLGDFYECAITNTADPATYTVVKDWVVFPDGGDVVIGAAHVTIECDSAIDGGDEDDGTWTLSDTLGDGDTLIASVDVTTGPATCSASEEIFESGVEASSEGCDPVALGPGGSHTCTFTNTVFFEGIPTLSRYGLALLALLMLGVGIMGVRRFA